MNVRRRKCPRCEHVHHAISQHGDICGTLISGGAFGGQRCACPNPKEVVKKKLAKTISWGVRTKRGSLRPWTHSTKHEAFHDSLPSFGDTVVRVEVREIQKR